MPIQNIKKLQQAIALDLNSREFSSPEKRDQARKALADERAQLKTIKETYYRKNKRDEAALCNLMSFYIKAIKFAKREGRALETVPTMQADVKALKKLYEDYIKLQSPKHVQKDLEMMQLVGTFVNENQRYLQRSQDETPTPGGAAVEKPRGKPGGVGDALQGVKLSDRLKKLRRPRGN